MLEYMSSKEEVESITESDIDSLFERDLAFHRPARGNYCQSLLWFTSGIIVSGLAFAVAFGSIFDQNRDGVCAAYSSRWSPPARDVDIRYKMVKYDGRFLQENIYRKDGSPEVDAAWHALGISLRPFVVPEEDAEKAGLTHSHVRLSKKYGGGYPVNLEGLHHMHCLNLVRQGLWFNYDYYKAQGKGAFENTDDILKLHVTHCLDTIRQQLMCTTDTGILGRVWIKNGTAAPTPFVDFNTEHKCKNYNAIVEWATAHQIDDDSLDAQGDLVEQPSDGDHIYPSTP